MRVVGSARFIDRVYRLIMRYADALREQHVLSPGEPSAQARELQRVTHRTIRDVTSDIEERLSFNTALAKIMTLVNEMYKVSANDEIAVEDFPIFREAAEALIRIFSPFAPHLAEELWESLGHEPFVMNAAWPQYNESLLSAATMKITVQINGRVRGNVSPRRCGSGSIWQAAQENPQITRWLEGREPRKKFMCQINC